MPSLEKTSFASADCRRRRGAAAPLLDYNGGDGGAADPNAIAGAANAAALSCFLSSLTTTRLTRLLAYKRALELGATTKTQSLPLLLYCNRRARLEALAIYYYVEVRMLPAARHC